MTAILLALAYLAVSAAVSIFFGMFVAAGNRNLEE
jgi:hypothetical protein